MSRLASAPAGGAPRRLPPSPLLRAPVGWWPLLLFLLLLPLPGQKGAAQSAFNYQDLCRYTWEAVDSDKVHYKINLCGHDLECGGSSTICAYDLKSKTYFSVGDASLMRSSKLLLEFNTTSSCSQQGTQHMLQSNINFYCGKTLGSPEFVTSSECVHYFEWKTFVACKKDLFRPTKEVPCYVFNEALKKRDLNPLIKTSGGYLVEDSDEELELYINICRNIGRPSSETRNCPEESAACLLKGSRAFDLGQPKEQLKQLDKDRLSVRYEKQYNNEGERPDFCNGHDPSVTVTFVCPEGRRREDTSPKLTAQSNCRYEIEWVTESACVRDYLESNSCVLTNEQHGIYVNLTPLTQSPGYVSPYVAKEREEYLYYLNICGKTTGGSCNDAYASSCQVKPQNNQKKVAGRFINQTLRYADGDLILTYPGGDACSSGFQRMTVINFECNQTADDDGKGYPEFTDETDCTYFFSWQTKYACVGEKEDLPCMVADKKKRYDLARLIRHFESEQNWEAVDGNPVEAEKKHFFINVCHKVLQKGAAVNCAKEASVCSVDKNNSTKNLGTFMSPPTNVGEKIQLLYSHGDECGQNKRIETKILLVCKPGDLESAPVLINAAYDGCFYEFEWHTAAACVLSKTKGDHCRVSDSQAGYSFDLSPLMNKTYPVSTSDYTFHISICGSVSNTTCGSNSAACQVKKSGEEAWSLGVPSAELSYYDGMIQLNYQNGTPYNDAKHTQRSTHITFLCDREAVPGVPEYQTEDNFTYNFKWYTQYVCPEIPIECVVTDPQTMEQYDLSSLSLSGDRSENWFAMDNSEQDKHKKYYINVCRPLNPIPGCQRRASVCEVTYRGGESTGSSVSNSNLGIASQRPIIEGHGRILLNYTGGSLCVRPDDDKSEPFSSLIHLSCSKGTLNSSPRFIEVKDCVATFLWETEAACPITTAKGDAQSCSVKDPNTGFVYNLEPLATENAYLAMGIGKNYMINICGPAKDCVSDSTPSDDSVGGCETEDLKHIRLVKLNKTLQLSTEGYLSLTYRGSVDTFTVTFICNESYPGELKFVHEDMNSALKIHNTFFEFHTALACPPAPVDCQVTDSAGNEYDLSDLSREDKPWVALDTSKDAKTRTFYLNVCKPLPYIPGCPGGIIGSCVKYGNKGQNLGMIQISPQAATDGSLSIVYLSGEKCKGNQQYSTRIIFQCDQATGSPVFQHEEDCEFVFLWRTVAACPLHRAEGENCQVKDPRYGYIYDLTSLRGKDIKVSTDEYDYFFRVCDRLTTGICKQPSQDTDVVSSCQIKKQTPDFKKIAGLQTTKLTYENGLIKINYTSGDTCHKIYQRSTAIFFYCDPHPNLEPVFLKETEDCTYMFEWHTPLACPPFRSVDCSYKDGAGNSYDLSSLTRHKENWEAISRTDSTVKYYINVCKSLVPHQGTGSCPPEAAVCLVDGSKHVSTGEIGEGLQWKNGILVLTYINGEKCPDQIRKKSTIIRFKCDENRIDSKPELITALEDCEYTFLWFTAAACPLKSNVHNNCTVSNPLTGHLFDLNPLKRQDGYTVSDFRNSRTLHLSVCDEARSPCGSGIGVCVTGGHQSSINAGRLNKTVTYEDGVLKLVYEGGQSCPADPGLKYTSYFSFVCRSDAGPGSQPVLVSFDEVTCTYYFSWHTALACEEESAVECSVRNGSTIIDLSPLIHPTGSYEAYDSSDVSDLTPDFYINICQPLNPIRGVNCPPGVAVCMVPVTGPPVDIGRITDPPKLNSETKDVFIVFKSTTPCAEHKSLNYSSRIMFHCNRGTNLGKPKMIGQSNCEYIFEWSTPVVCLDKVEVSGCSVTDEQLHFPFNLSSLSGKSYKVFSGSRSYHLGVCSGVADVPEGKCKDAAVCLVSDNKAISFGNRNEMKMDYRHQDEAVILQYKGGDACPPVTEMGEVCVFPFQYKGKIYSKCIMDEHERPWCATTENMDRDNTWGFCGNVSGHRESTIVFKCDDNAGNGSPQLLSETLDCAVTFEWKTQIVCPPRKMECKFIQKHKTYDLRVLSSLTGSWVFADKDSSSYYMNLCQRVHEGPTGCPEQASVCRKNPNGAVQVLGLVHTQKLNVTDDKVLVSYSNGHECQQRGKKATTVIELKCAKTVGMPRFDRIDEENCAYYITWETRAACAVKPQEVNVTNGIVINPVTGANFSLGDIYYKLYNASGDIRANGDIYIYEIQLSSITHSKHQQCLGANICQVKKSEPRFRRIGSSDKAKYYIQDDDLDVVFSSDSSCGRDRTKFASSTIFFHCSEQAKEGIPEFLHESSDCQYLFTWYTSAVCPLVTSETTNDKTSEEDHFYKGLSGRSQAVGALLSLLLVVLTACLVILLLYKKERRETMKQKIANCCRRTSNVSYKYTKINTEEVNENETEWLMEEVAAPNQKSGNEVQENGHIASKAVKSNALTSLQVDDMDSEDEVLTIPEVKIHSARDSQSRGLDTRRPHYNKPLNLSSSDKANLINSSKKSKGSTAFDQRKLQNSTNTASFHDDSDEDLLNV